MFLLVLSTGLLSMSIWHAIMSVCCVNVLKARAVFSICRVNMLKKIISHLQEVLISYKDILSCQMAVPLCLKA